MNSAVATQVTNGLGPEIFSEPETFYRAALESLSEGVMILDADCRIIYANQLVYEITGYQPVDLLGQTPQLLRADADTSPCPAGKAPEGEPKSFEFEMKCKDGRLHWLNVRSTPYRNGTGEVLGRVVALSLHRPAEEPRIRERIPAGRVPRQLRQHHWAQPGAPQSARADRHRGAD